MPKRPLPMQYTTQWQREIDRAEALEQEKRIRLSKKMPFFFASGEDFSRIHIRKILLAMCFRRVFLISHCHHACRVGNVSRASKQMINFCVLPQSQITNQSLFSFFFVTEFKCNAIWIPAKSQMIFLVVSCFSFFYNLFLPPLFDCAFDCNYVLIQFY